jgi:hypothetical protein
MKPHALHTQHAALVGGSAALACGCMGHAVTGVKRSRPATGNLLPQIAARI